MKRTKTWPGIVLAILSLLIFAALFGGCDWLPYHCDGPHPSLPGEELCFCNTGELCDHSGFGPCSECRSP